MVSGEGSRKLGTGTQVILKKGNHFLLFRKYCSFYSVYVLLLTDINAKDFCDYVEVKIISEGMVIWKIGLGFSKYTPVMSQRYHDHVHDWMRYT